MGVGSSQPFDDWWRNLAAKVVKVLRSVNEKEVTFEVRCWVHWVVTVVVTQVVEHRKMFLKVMSSNPSVSQLFDLFFTKN